jgi:hypothetical protein
VGARFEVVVFTASLAKYADPLINLLDVGRVVPPHRYDDRPTAFFISRSFSSVARALLQTLPPVNCCARLQWLASQTRLLRWNSKKRR